jgi:hypothetical protein
MLNLLDYVAGQSHTAIRGLLFIVMLFALPVYAEGLDLPAKGQIVYVPIYSEVRHGNLSPSGQPNSLLMSILVSIRNTDSAQNIHIIRAPYYNTAGKLVRNYVSKTITVAPFATSEIFVELNENAGGSGANFAIEWEAEKPVSPPIIEALHSRFQAGYSVSFISRGKAISTR